jgi:uncharacterized membrane protein YeiH
LAWKAVFAAISSHLDFFGLMVLSFCTELGGGIIRDLLIDASPPASIRYRRYGMIAFLGGRTAVVFYRFVQEIPQPLLVTLDAGGLALFAIAGAAKALSCNINPLLAILMGTITGVGGGTVRDVLLARIPTVLLADVYATAAVLGAAMYVTGVSFKLRPRLAATLGRRRASR